MGGNFDFGTLLLLVALLLLPAVVVFTIATVIRVRRSKFRRQRVPSRSRKVAESEEAKKP